MKRLLIVAALALAGAGTTLASPVVLFEDNFDTETPGLEVPYVTPAPSQWTVTGGTVDIIGAGTVHDYPGVSGHGLYIDLDGTDGGVGGLMTTVASFDLEPGYIYTLSFDLAGNQGGLGGPNGGLGSATDAVQWSLGLWGGTYVVSRADGFTTYTQGILLSESWSDVHLTFQNIDAYDWIGPLLDNVRLTAQPVVPVPGAVLLSGLGAGLVGWLRRRQVL